jgi:hypothetical protein
LCMMRMDRSTSPAAQAVLVQHSLEIAKPPRGRCRAITEKIDPKLEINTRDLEKRSSR